MGFSTDTLPSHSPHLNASSTSPTSRYKSLIRSLTTVICFPTKILSRRAFLPALILFVLILLYTTDHDTSNSYDSTNTKLQFLTNTFVLGTSGLAGNGIKGLGSKYSMRHGKKHLLFQEQKKLRELMEAKESKWKDVGSEIFLSESLETRLKDWENSPLEGLEHNEWKDQNLKTCTPSRILANRNQEQFKLHNEAWNNLTVSNMVDLRRELITYLRKAKLEGKMSQSAWGKGKGLVFTAGNSNTFSRVLTTMRLLTKHLDTHLPAEIFSFPGEVPSDEIRKELESLGAKLFIVENAVKDTTREKSFHIKATAIIRSSFREVLFLDSDNLPAAGLSPIPEGSTPNITGTRSDSAGLWEAKAYKRLGVMFWSDYWKTSAENSIWAIIGVPCRDEWEQESGQILIDKALHLDTLLLAEYMMDSSRFKFWMQFSDGDKDIFRYSFLALRKRWGVPGRYVGVGAFPWDVATGFGGHTMIQHDHLGKPLFVHANLLKMIPSGVGPGYAWGQTKSVSLPSSAYHFPRDDPFESESSSELEDYSVDCDQLADASIEGQAIKHAVPAVRRRAIMERGLKAWIHGGQSSAMCTDMAYKDIRTESDVDSQRHILNSLKDSDIVHDPKSLSEEARPEITLTADGLEFYWGEDSLSVNRWSDDVRLKQFESTFFAEGGKLN